MQNMKNFKQYIPTEEQLNEWELPANALYMISEDGQDWYQCQQDFAPDTLKILYDEEMVIRCISHDVEYMTPLNFSIVEVPDTPENRRADISGDWVYVDGKVSRRVYSADEWRTRNGYTLEGLMAKAAMEIAPLQDAIDIGRATDEQKAELIAWKTYRVDLLELRNSDLGKPDLNWPMQPNA